MVSLLSFRRWGFKHFSSHHVRKRSVTASNLFSTPPTKSALVARTITAVPRNTFAQPRCQVWKRSHAKSSAGSSCTWGRSKSEGSLVKGDSVFMDASHGGTWLWKSSQRTPGRSARHLWHIPFGSVLVGLACFAALKKDRARCPDRWIKGQSPITFSVQKKYLCPSRGLTIPWSNKFRRSVAIAFKRFS